jgi:hypothetical protein
VGLLDRLFGRTAAVSQDPLLPAALQRAVELIEPRLALARDWRARLAPGVEAAISCAREVACRLEPLHPLSRAAWSDSALLRAAFPSPQAVDQTLRAAREVQRFFRMHRSVAQAHAVLGMRVGKVMQFDRELVEGRVMEDVQVERASFSAHQLKVVAADPEALRQAAGARVFNDLMLAAARRLAEAASRGKDLSVVRAMLQAQLRMLERNEGTLLSDEPGVATDAAADLQSRRTEIELQLARLSDSIAEAGTGADALERQLDIARDTLLHARQVLRIERQALRLDGMNRVLPYDDPRGQLVEFDTAQGASADRAFVAVSIRRQDVPEGGLRISTVERTL